MWVVMVVLWRVRCWWGEARGAVDGGRKAAAAETEDDARSKAGRNKRCREEGQRAGKANI